MTGRAARQHLFAADLVVNFQLAAFSRVDIAVLPLHVIDLALRPNEFFRLAMAFQTPFHLERLLLKHGRHVIDLPVTGRAADALCYVNAVVEIRVLGKVVNTFPFDGFVLAEALSDRFEIRAVGPDLAVAVHTGLRRWHSGRSRRFYRLMAVPAVDPVIADVMLVAELHRLLFLDIASGQVRGTG